MFDQLLEFIVRIIEFIAHLATREKRKAETGDRGNGTNERG